jgi:hypothetical protein
MIVGMVDRVNVTLGNRNEMITLEPTKATQIAANLLIFITVE